MAFSKARRLSDFISADGSIPAGKFTDSTITSAHIVDATIVPADMHATLNLTGKTVTVATASGSTNSTAVASTAFVQQELTTLIGGAPSTLNDLNELAAAINDDANYNSTLTTALATKLPLAGGTLTGALSGTTAAFNAGATNVVATFVSTDGTAGIKLQDSAGNIELSAAGAVFQVQPSGGAASMTVSGSQLSLASGVSINQTVASGGGDFLNINHSGNEAWSFGARSGAGSDDYVDVGIQGGVRTMSWHENGKVGIGTTTIDNNAKLHIEDSGYPIINLDRSSSLTTGNHLGYINFQNNGDVYGYIGTWVESASGTDGKLVFATQNGTSLTDKMTINSTGHLTLIPASGFSGLNNSLLGSTNGYLYAMGGSAGLYLADNSDLSNAIGIRNANYIDFTTGGQTTHKFDTAGIHFQRADGQSITAKESLVITIDSDNNTASRVFTVNDGNGKTLLNLHDDYRTEVGTLQYSSTRSAGAGAVGGFSAAANDWVDIAAIPYGRNIATIKFFWDGVSAPSSAHHGNMEFDIGSHYGTSYYYGWDSYINLKASSAHNSFYIKEARIITPNGSGATGYFQVKFGVACSTGTFRCYVTSRDENCSIDPVNPAVNNSRSGTTIAEVLLDNRPSIATSRDVTVTGLVRAQGQPAFRATGNQGWSTLSSGVQVPFNIAVVNTGGDYSASNKRFTAPVTGNYFLAWHTYNDNGYNNAIVPRVNGTALTGGGGDDIVAYSASGLTGNLTVSASIVQSLAKGDLVDMACRGGHNSRIYMPHSQFSGFLIG